MPTTRPASRPACRTWISRIAAPQFAEAAGGAIAFDTAGAVSIERSLFQSNRVHLANTLPSFCASAEVFADGFEGTAND